MRDSANDSADLNLCMSNCDFEEIARLELAVDELVDILVDYCYLRDGDDRRWNLIKNTPQHLRSPDVAVCLFR